MAGLFFTVDHRLTPFGTEPDTLIQLLADANQRAILHSVEFDPIAAAAGAALEFDWVLQTSATGMTADATLIHKHTPQGSETVRTTVLKGNSDANEPTLGEVLFSFGLHPLSQRLWTPPTPDRKIVIFGAQRHGFRLRTTGVTYPIRLSLVCEE
jgi:hypothetical protein